MSIILIVIGIFGKLTGAIATIPDPIVGGASMLALGLVISVGMAQLHSVDLDAVRNQMALGMALLLGIMLPSYLADNQGVINTGVQEVDQMLLVFLSTGPFVGGVVGCILDNLLPGTKRERGMDVATCEKVRDEDCERKANIYELPFCMSCNQCSIFSWFPCLPCYINRCEGETCCPCTEDPPNNDIVDINDQNVNTERILTNQQWESPFTVRKPDFLSENASQGNLAHNRTKLESRLCAKHIKQANKITEIIPHCELHNFSDYNVYSKNEDNKDPAERISSSTRL